MSLMMNTRLINPELKNQPWFRPDTSRTLIDEESGYAWITLTQQLHAFVSFFFIEISLESVRVLLSANWRVYRKSSLNRWSWRMFRQQSYPLPTAHVTRHCSIESPWRPSPQHRQKNMTFNWTNPQNTVVSVNPNTRYWVLTRIATHTL